MQKWRTGFLAIAFLICLNACSIHREHVSSGDKTLARQFTASEILKGHQYGFALYDPEDNEYIYERLSDHYFTPASNTKILTLLAAQHYLGDSTETLRYTYRGDSLFFWGAFDPSFLYDTAFVAKRAFDLLRDHRGPLVYAPRLPVDRFGAGWMWDDYGSVYQVERSTMPIYGNRVHVNFPDADAGPVVEPEYFESFLTVNPALRQLVWRSPEANSFEVNPGWALSFPRQANVPFATSDYLCMELLRDTLRRDLSLNYSFKHQEQNNAVRGEPLDSLYKHLMRESNNFIAEQLLLQCADLFEQDPVEVEEFISRTKETLFAGMPDEVYWYDGSGLSRYNLCTPRSLIWALQRLFDNHSMSYLQTIFPAAGRSGTLRDVYTANGDPYVFAKSGTLKNNYALSGYLVTRRGRILLFSFMHGNVVMETDLLKREIDRILRFIHREY